mmetsp:Transcript_6152/g.15754  ORF Transcript_6152/g.15754 Transcript_6152/m.15754 type:complete len:205 (+) Transcript_6152:721-1335(+)
MTSVARLMPSRRDSRQPYRLSNLDLVTESLTLMAGILSSPFSNILWRLCTPVVVSSDTPLMPARSSGNLAWTRFVRSPPSSRIMLSGLPSGKMMVCSMHQLYSSSVSPFQAYTGTPVAAMAAAASSWVEKMLHDDQVTSAPRAVRVSMSTAVCVVMWRQPAIRAPLSGLDSPNFVRRFMRPGISCSESMMSLRPRSAREMSATL